jgi:hypothetical protein
MRKLGVFQLLGPVALFAALAAAEGAAFALQQAPSCAWLWYVNLTCFDVFQRTHYALQAVTGDENAQFALIALPLISAAAVGVIYKRTLLLALSSNLSFVYIIFVALVWRGFTPGTQASLSAAFQATVRPDVVILAVLVGLSLVSFVISHIVYITQMRANPA